VYALLFSDINFHGSIVDARVLAFTALVTVATGLVTGLLPAVQITRPELSSAVKTGDREGGGQRSRTRAALLIAQTAMSLILLFGAGLFVRSLANLNAVRLGVDVDRVLVGSMNVRAVGRTQADADRIFAIALERVSAMPGVAYAAGASTIPFGGSFGAAVGVPGPDSLVHASAMSNRVTPQYFHVLGARILRGRDFQESDGASAPRVAIVNEMFATRYWGARDPIGACVRIDSDSLPCAQIVGIVENVRRQSIFEDSTGFIYQPVAQTAGDPAMRKILMRVDRGNPAAMIEPMRMAMQTAAPQLPFADVHLIADEPIVRRELRPFRMGAAMFGVFGALALVLASVGIYGVVSYNVGQRTREMGVRIALGADARSVAGMVVAGGVSVALIGTVIGTGLVLLGAKFVAPLLYAESPRDPLVLGAVSVLLLAVAAAACLLPAWKAVHTDPIVALRSE
jgi:putative ABC transport system permease protein